MVTTPAVRSIVVALDGSPFGEQSIPYAQRLALALAAPVTLVMAAHLETFVSPVSMVGVGAYIPPDTLQTVLDDEIALRQEYVDTVRQRLVAAGCTVETRVEFGYPASLVLNTAHGLPDAMIIMTTHGRTGVRRTVLGSVANEVVCTSDRPVLLVRPSDAAAGADHPVRRLLVALDGSALSEQVLPVVRQLAPALGAAVTLLEVADQAASVPQATAYLDRLAGDLHGDGVDALVAVRVGPPPETILAEAASGGADLLAMTTHGRSGVGRWLMGSVADRVLQAADIPLLIVRAAGE